MKKMSKKLKTILLCVGVLVLASVAGLGIWFLSKPAGGNVLGVEWYDEAGTEFTITTADELMEVAALSKYYDFKDQTIKLGADIVMNAAGPVSYAKDIDISWFDGSGDYKIADAADLKGLAALSKEYNFEDDKITLTADISLNKTEGVDVEEWKDNAPDYTWTMIGEETKPFAGAFDGAGHEISGVYVNATVNYAGFFARISPDAKVSDVRIVKSYIGSTGQYVGSVAGGTQGGSVEKVYSDAIVDTSNKNVGAMLGNAQYGASISECWFAGKFINTGAGQHIGGIVGYADDTNTVEKPLKITNCLNSGIMDLSENTAASPLAGSIFGRNYNGAVEITSCLSTRAIKVGTAQTGGYASIIGHTNKDATITGSYGIDRLYVKGGAAAVTVQNSTNVGRNVITGTSDSVKALLSGLDFDTTWMLVEGNTPILKGFEKYKPGKETVPAETGTDTGWYIDETAGLTYILSDAADLKGFAELSGSHNFAGQTIRLAADIALNKSEQWNPIGKSKAFAGTFDGDGYSISGISCAPSAKNTGLFGQTAAGAVVKNFRLLDSSFVDTKGNVGAVVGLASGGTFENIYTEATVTSSAARVGGLIGMINSSSNTVTISKCWNAGTITSTADVYSGGIVGSVYTGMVVVNNCLNTGMIDASAISAKNPLAGGLIGGIEKNATGATIESSLNVGEVRKHQDRPTGYGSVAGAYYKAMTVNNTYGMTESCPNLYVKAGSESVSGTGAKKVAQADITGTADSVKTTLAGFDFENVWKLVNDKTPELNQTWK